ncbi:hypothetical protein [Actinomadura keratinilytica]|uniref:Secreted protein n=1 Tax=Actinomadura keratinilytica TaxID=547461 RepID=A0ABP7Y6I7_9ACTN
MRPRLPAAVMLTAASVASLTLAAPPAQAASAPAAQAPIMGWEIEGKYWTYDGCVSTGHQGVERGDWSRFQCRPGKLQWVLWVLRP